MPDCAGRVPGLVDAAWRATPNTRCWPLSTYPWSIVIQGTNVLERLNGEIKRRANVVGIFPTESAVRRLVGALLMQQNDEYSIQNRCVSLESLATISENPAIRLPAAPALA